MRAFPGAFRLNSVYALFPCQTPAKTKENLEKLGVAHKYDFERPKHVAGWHAVKTRDAVERVLCTFLPDCGHDPKS